MAFTDKFNKKLKSEKNRLSRIFSKYCLNESLHCFHFNHAMENQNGKSVSPIISSMLRFYPDKLGLGMTLFILFQQTINKRLILKNNLIYLI